MRLFLLVPCRFKTGKGEHGKIHYLGLVGVYESYWLSCTSILSKISTSRRYPMRFSLLL